MDSEVSFKKKEINIFLCCLGGGFKYFYVHTYLGKWSKLTNMFQRGWNHQLVGDLLPLNQKKTINSNEEQIIDPIYLFWIGQNEIYRRWCQRFLLCSHRNLGKCSNLTSMGWNHQLGMVKSLSQGKNTKIHRLSSWCSKRSHIFWDVIWQRFMEQYCWWKKSG